MGTDCKGCCVYPHGRMSIFAQLFSIVAFLFGSNALWTCHYASTSASFDVGLLTRENFDSNDDYNCEAWESLFTDQFDGKWKAGIGLGITAQVIGFITMVAMICLACMSFQMEMFKVWMVTSLFNGLFWILTLIALSSDFCGRVSGGGDCGFNTGAGLAIGASLSWWCTALLISRIGPEDDVPDFDAPYPAAAPETTGSAPPGTVTVTETVLPDGTKKVIKTTVNADGSKTVVETVTPAAGP